jgi:hypothetical protein
MRLEPTGLTFARRQDTRWRSAMWSSSSSLPRESIGALGPRLQLRLRLRPRLRRLRLRLRLRRRLRLRLRLRLELGLRRRLRLLLRLRLRLRRMDAHNHRTICASGHHSPCQLV